MLFVSDNFNSLELFFCEFFCWSHSLLEPLVTQTNQCLNFLKNSFSKYWACTFSMKYLLADV